MHFSRVFGTRSSLIIGLFSLTLLFTACEKDPIEPSNTEFDYSDHSLVLEWNRLFLEAERFTPGYRPPVSARASGYIGLIAYEAAVHGTSGEYNSIAPVALPLPDPDLTYHWETAVHAAYEAAFFHFFPTTPAEQQFQIRSFIVREKERLQSALPPSVYFRSHEYGQRIANLIIRWASEDDWGHEAFNRNADPAYNPPSGPSLWQPTFPDFTPALLPHWGKVRTFAALPSDVADRPLDFSTETSSELFRQADEVRVIVNRIKDGELPDELWIAHFWSDDCPILTFTPSGRFISIANQLVELENLDLFDALYLYAKTGMALNDAGVKCWEGKYDHNYLRPIDYIREYQGEPDWNTVMCPDGSGNYFTPNFPAYPSGHATFAAAACTVFADIFGEEYTFTDRSHEGRTEFDGRPRTYQRFSDMALENAYSRIPLGVHFQMDADAGVELGNIIGQRINELPWK